MGLPAIWWPLAVMVVDWVAVARSWKRLECVAKPAAMLALLAWLWVNSVASEHWAPALGWFAAGLGVLLGGGGILLLPARYFVGGLIAVLLGPPRQSVGVDKVGLVLPTESRQVAPLGRRC